MGARKLRPVDGLDPNALPYLRFKDSPTPSFVEAVVAHIKATGEPETFDGLYRGRLPVDAKYKIIHRIQIDGRKRPNGDHAPCPMCTPNRFLKGVLAWFYELQVCAVIGHECATHADVAEREYKSAETLRQQEDYLLAALPQLREKRAVLATMKAAANDAETLFRAFRRKLPRVHTHLRNLRDRHNAQFVATEILANEEEERPLIDYGPAGFRRRDEFKSRDHNYGPMHGSIAVMKDYRPVTELNDAIRYAEAFEFDGDEAAAMNFICDLTMENRGPAVTILQSLDALWLKFSERINDFAAFWSSDNLRRLNAYGTSPYSPISFEARRTVIGGRYFVILEHERVELRMQFSERLENLDRPWSAFTYKKP